nr:hypothetical protein [Saccharopolyspora spinosa]
MDDSGQCHERDKRTRHDQWCPSAHDQGLSELDGDQRHERDRVGLAQGSGRPTQDPRTNGGQRPRNSRTSVLSVACELISNTDGFATLFDPPTHQQLSLPAE